MRQTIPVILASASPRRREILTMLGVDFTVEVSDTEETTGETEPGRIVSELAACKAEAVASRHSSEDFLVIGSDTIVWKDGKMLGKPADCNAAAAMLSDLSGDTDSVYTGVCLIMKRNGKVHRETFYERADVAFAPMSEEEIRWYVSTGEPMDKAGAYAVQGLGGRFITGIYGDFYTVVGLPMCGLYNRMRNLGVLTEQ